MKLSVNMYTDDLQDPIAEELLQRDRSGVEAAVDAELERFSDFCTKQLGEPLVPPERAIIKTFLGWKLGLANVKEKNAP
jgi:hypothetical protein